MLEPGHTISVAPPAVVGFLLRHGHTHVDMDMRSKWFTGPIISRKFSWEKCGEDKHTHAATNMHTIAHRYTKQKWIACETFMELKELRL